MTFWKFFALKFALENQIRLLWTDESLPTPPGLSTLEWVIYGAVSRDKIIARDNSAQPLLNKTEQSTGEKKSPGNPNDQNELILTVSTNRHQCFNPLLIGCNTFDANFI